MRARVGGWTLLCCCLLLVSCSGNSRPTGKGAGTSSASSGTAAATGGAQLEDFAGALAPALQGWMGRLGRSPSDFTNLTRSSEGWNYLWEAELVKAIETFAASQAEAPPGQDLPHRIGLGRSLLELGEFHQRLYEATLEFLQQYLNERQQRRDKIGPITPAEQLYAAQARLLREGGPAADDVATALRELAAAPAAGVFGTMARAWLGLALSLKGDVAGAEQAWKEALAAEKTDPNAALLVAYTQARAGRWPGGVLPDADGTSYGRRLRVAALVRTGGLEQALREIDSLRFRKPDHSIRLTEAGSAVATQENGEETAGTGSAAPVAPDAVGSLDEEKTNLDFFAPYVLEELARARFLRAAKVLEGAGEPGGCAAYWRARALEAAGETAAAAALYLQVQSGPLSRTAGPAAAPPAATAPSSDSAAAPAAPAPGSASAPGSSDAAAKPASPTLAPDDPIACLALGVHGTLQELAKDAGLRAALLQGKPLDGLGDASWANRLTRAVGKAAAAPGAADALAGTSFLPEDPRTLESALEAAFEKEVPENGLNALFRGRFFERYVHDLYVAQARVAALVGERRLTVKILEALHDNTQQDEITTLNRPGFLLDSTLARWKANDPQGAAVLLNVLWRRFPETWPTSEYVRRIRAFQALDNIKSGTVSRGQ